MFSFQKVWEEERNLLYHNEVDQFVLIFDIDFLYLYIYFFQHFKAISCNIGVLNIKNSEILEFSFHEQFQTSVTDWISFEIDGKYSFLKGVVQAS